MTMRAFIQLLVIHFAAISSQQLCDNVDDQACQGFAANINICIDPCLSKLCPRTCKFCPLKCYDCNGLSSPTMCNTTMICSDNSYFCFVTESLGDDFSINYRQGCASSDVCTRLFGSVTPTLIGRRSNLEGECCEDDLCNRHRPVGKRQVDFFNFTLAKRTTTPSFGTTIPLMMTTIHPRTTTPTFATQTTTPPTMMTSQQPNLSSKCNDIDHASCQRLAMIKRDMCTDDCMVQACPRTCGKCAECYSCQHVSNPANCTNHTVCEPGEKCYVLKTLSFSGEQGYKMGCMLDSVCKQFNTQAGNVFGKRNDPVELSVDGDCCTGDLCNHVALTHGSTVTTKAPSTGVGCRYTVSSHNCPTNFHLVDGKCMMVGPSQLSYAKAEAYCHSHCSMLMENFSEKEARGISYFIQSQLQGRSNYVYIGAQDADHDGDYTWNVAGTVVAHSSSPVSGHYCLTYSVITRGVHPVSCLSLHYVLCQTPMK